MRRKWEGAALEAEVNKRIADRTLGVGELQREVNVAQAARIAELEVAIRRGRQDIYRAWR